MDIYVTEMKFEKGRLKCYTEQKPDNCKAINQMIVDSDDFSFIYLLDNGVEYVRLHFVEETWEMLNRYKGHKVIVNDTITLTDFYNELEYLIENIEGNNNYPKAFEEKVIETFKS